MSTSVYIIKCYILLTIGFRFKQNINNKKRLKMHFIFYEKIKQFNMDYHKSPKLCLKKMYNHILWQNILGNQLMQFGLFVY